MSERKTDDPFLEKYLVRYDKWLDKGQISYSSRVIPVHESLQAEKHILPGEQVWKILQDAKSVALQNCACRSHYKRCDNPLEVCFLLNKVGDSFVAKGLAHHVTLSEAAEVLKKANKCGLVHLTLYMPNHELYALCSCCVCCCHDLQIVRLYNRQDLMLRSEYVAVTDTEACTDCCQCVERCIFNARTIQDDQMVYNPEACLGCGLCVTICPEDATIMKIRE